MWLPAVTALCQESISNHSFFSAGGTPHHCQEQIKQQALSVQRAFQLFAKGFLYKEKPLLIWNAASYPGFVCACSAEGVEQLVITSTNQLIEVL